MQNTKCSTKDMPYVELAEVKKPDYKEYCHSLYLLKMSIDSYSMKHVKKAQMPDLFKITNK